MSDEGKLFVAMARKAPAHPERTLRALCDYKTLMAQINSVKPSNGPLAVCLLSSFQFVMYNL